MFLFPKIQKIWIKIRRTLTDSVAYIRSSKDDDRPPVSLNYLLEMNVVIKDEMKKTTISTFMWTVCRPDKMSDLKIIISTARYFSSTDIDLFPIILINRNEDSPMFHLHSTCQSKIWIDSETERKKTIFHIRQWLIISFKRCKNERIVWNSNSAMTN